VDRTKGLLECQLESHSVSRNIKERWQNSPLVTIHARFFLVMYVPSHEVSERTLNPNYFNFKTTHAHDRVENDESRIFSLCESSNEGGFFLQNSGK
jgi:hypothetical protein